MADRPPAAELLRRHPDLEHWLRTEWDRPVDNSRIYWADDPPVASATAENAPNPDYHLIVIRVSKKLTPVDQLLALAFETCNAQGRSGFDAVNAQAVAGKITRDDFVNQIDAREYAALLRVKDSFPKLLPLSGNEIAATTLYRKLLEVPPEFHEYQAWSIRTQSTNYLQAQKLYADQYNRLAKKRTNQ